MEDAIPPTTEVVGFLAYRIVNEIQDIHLKFYRKELMNQDINPSKFDNLHDEIGHYIKQVTELMTILNDIDLIYKIGSDDCDTQAYIRKTLTRITKKNITSKNYGEFFMDEMKKYRELKQELRDFAGEITKSWSKTISKTRSRKARTTINAKRFGDKIIKNAMKIGGFHR